MSYGVAESELLTEDTVLRRVQGADEFTNSGHGWTLTRK